MICPKCNFEIKDGSKFCTNCGEPLSKTKKCVQCGASIKEEVLFCTNCGTKQPVKEEKPKIEEVQPKNEVKAENPTPKKEEKTVVAETPKKEKKSTVSESKSEQNKSTPKKRPKKKQIVQESPEQKNTTRKKKNQWIPILITVALVCLWYVIKPSKSEPNEESIEYSTTPDGKQSTGGFESEADIRSFLCKYVFVGVNGDKIMFANNANELIMNGRTMTYSLVIESYELNKAELYFQGEYGNSRFHLLVVGDNGMIKDKSDLSSYHAYTTVEAEMSKNYSEYNEDDDFKPMTLEEFYNDYVFGNKDFSKIANKVCTPRLLQYLKDAYEYECEDGECYAMWLFRSGNQDGTSDECRVVSVKDEGDGWVGVLFIDMGVTDSIYIRFVPYNGQKLMDEIWKSK